MLENAVSTRKKALSILQNLFDNKIKSLKLDSLRDPQEEADYKRAHFTRKTQKIHHRHYAEKQNNPSDQMHFMKTSAVHWSDTGERKHRTSWGSRIRLLKEMMLRNISLE